MEKRKRRIEEVDWAAYFEHIRSVCPWSYAAYKNQEIFICEYDGEIYQLSHFKVIVYHLKNYSPRRCAKLAKSLQNQQYEFLWSHPQDGDEYSTPIPVLIQQDRETLLKIRQVINTNTAEQVRAHSAH